MGKYIYAEMLKQKHSFHLQLLWLGPLVTAALVIALMGGRYFVEASYNWWYTMLLPGILAILLAFSFSREKKHNRHGLLAVCAQKEKLWIAQLAVNTLFLFAANLIFWLVMAGCCWFLGISAPLPEMLLASLCLWATFMWQIPVFLWMSERAGAFVTVFVCLICNMGFGIFFAPSRLWYIPFAIPARLMCSVIRVQPNGLPIEGESALCGASTVAAGVMITVGLYVLFCVLTTLSFRHEEVR